MYVWVVMCACGPAAEVPSGRRMAEGQEKEDREGAVEATQASYH